MKELINELNERGFVESLNEITVAGHTRQEVFVKSMPETYRIINVIASNDNEFHILRKDSLTSISPEEFLENISDSEIRDFLSHHAEKLVYQS